MIEARAEAGDSELWLAEKERADRGARRTAASREKRALTRKRSFPAKEHCWRQPIALSRSREPGAPAPWLGCRLVSRIRVR